MGDDPVGAHGSSPSPALAATATATPTAPGASRCSGSSSSTASAAVATSARAESFGGTAELPRRRRDPAAVVATRPGQSRARRWCGLEGPRVACARGSRGFPVRGGGMATAASSTGRGPAVAWVGQGTRLGSRVRARARRSRAAFRGQRVVCPRRRGMDMATTRRRRRARAKARPARVCGGEAVEVCTCGPWCAWGASRGWCQAHTRADGREAETTAWRGKGQAETNEFGAR